MLKKGGFELLTKNRTKEKCGKGIKRRRENQSTREKDSPETDETSFVVEQDVSANGIFSLLLCSEMLSVEAFALGVLKKRFGAGVVVRRAGAAHALERAVRGGLATETHEVYWQPLFVWTIRFLLRRRASQAWRNAAIARFRSIVSLTAQPTTRLLNRSMNVHRYS